MNILDIELKREIVHIDKTFFAFYIQTEAAF